MAVDGAGETLATSKALTVIVTASAEGARWTIGKDLSMMSGVKNNHVPRLRQRSGREHAL